MTRSIIISTDLDGTLLDHDNYSFSAALPALKKIKALKIPLILNSSKTFKEIATINQQLNNHFPYIVENGAAIYSRQEVDSNTSLLLQKNGMDRTKVLSILSSLKATKKYDFTGFADMTLTQLQNSTGLNLESAKLAQQREFTEPILWNDTSDQFLSFKNDLHQHELTAVKGGRFIHISSPFNKGSAIKWLKHDIETKTKSKTILISLGDSENDVPMLEYSDYAILVRSPVKEFPKVQHHQLIKTEKNGPAGWNDAVLELLETIINQNSGDSNG